MQKPDNRHWLVPRRSNPLFTGQSQLRTKLKEQLLPDIAGFNEREDSKVFVLHGIGGVGKSEICIKFAEEHRKWLVHADISNYGSTDKSSPGFGESFGSTHPAAVAPSEASSRLHRDVALVEQTWMTFASGSRTTNTAGYSL
jgi:hypothetical protein